MPSTQSVTLLIRSNRRYIKLNRRNPQQCGPGDVYVIRWYEERGTKTHYKNVGSDLNGVSRLRMEKEMSLAQPQEAIVPEKQSLGLFEAIPHSD